MVHLRDILFDEAISQKMSPSRSNIAKTRLYCLHPCSFFVISCQKPSRTVCHTSTLLWRQHRLIRPVRRLVTLTTTLSFTDVRRSWMAKIVTPINVTGYQPEKASTPGYSSPSAGCETSSGSTYTHDTALGISARNCSWSSATIHQYRWVQHYCITPKCCVFIYILWRILSALCDLTTNKFILQVQRVCQFGPPWDNFKLDWPKETSFVRIRCRQSCPEVVNHGFTEIRVWALP